MPHVLITPDDMEARLVLDAGERLDEYQALVHVARRGVRHGLLHEAIAAFPELEGPAEVVVARAVPPTPGTDACVETPLGNTAFALEPAYDAHGRAIFPELLVPTVALVGDVVAVKVPPVPGRHGRTVTGTPIGPEPAPIQDVELRAGLGTELAYDGLRVVATVDGNPCCVEGVVTVRPELKLGGDVDERHGDVRFGGNVTIAGDVAGEVEVLAAGDVTVLGDVMGARLASGGRVVVHGAVGKHATIIASADVVARAMANVTVRCGGTLAVREDLIVATVEGARHVIVGAAVEGGTVSASERLDARTVGGEGGTPTRLHVMPAAGRAPGAEAPHIRVRGVIHAGVEVRIARAVTRFTADQPAGVLREAAGEVALVPGGAA